MNWKIILWGLLSLFTTPAIYSQACKADFSYQIECRTITVTDLSTPSNDLRSWRWTFPGGTPSTFNGKNPPPVTYATPGNKTVTLTIETDTYDCINSISKIVNIPVQPTASFSWNVSTCTSEITFNGNIPFGTTFIWDFGFGLQNTTQPNPVIDFPNPGEYDVSLKVFSEIANCEIEYTRKVTVYPAIIPSFTLVKEDDHCSLIPVIFENTTPTYGVEDIIFQWDFGDGTLYTGFQPPPHVFNAFGTGPRDFPVRLTAINSKNNCSGTTTRTVTVRRRPDARLQGTLEIPVDHNNAIRNCANASSTNPNFTIELHYSPTVVTSNSRYRIVSNPGNIIIWDESFPPTLSPLNHTYYELGIFELIFSVISTSGCHDERVYQVINIGSPSIGMESQGNTQGCGLIDFTFLLSGMADHHPSTTYRVNFGDGTILDLPYPSPTSITHTYTRSACTEPFSDGQYVVQFTATNLCGQATMSVDAVRVYSSPNPDFRPANYSTCVNQPHVFNNNTPVAWGPDCNNRVLLKWDFGDGTIQGPAEYGYPYPNASYTYTTPGIYDVILSAMNVCNAGEMVDTEFQVCVENNDPAEFNLSDFTGCAPFTVETFNVSHEKSICNSNAYKWTVVEPAEDNCRITEDESWEFASGGVNSANPSFTFYNPGEYTIRMALTNGCNNNSIFERTIVVKGPPVVEELTGIEGGCAPVTLQPSVSVVNCDVTTPTVNSFKWSFPGGNPETSTVQSPGNITYPNTGIYYVTVSALNECGESNELTKHFSVNPPIENNNISLADSKPVCQGELPGTITGTNTPILTGGDGTYQFSWEMSTNSSFTNPLATGVTTRNLDYNNPLEANTFFRRVVRSGGCFSISDPVEITVIPGITNNTITGDQVICQGDIPGILTGSAPSGGASGNYTYQWQRNTVPATTWVNIAGGTSKDFQPPQLFASASYRRVVNSDPADDCQSTSSVITITVNARPAITSPLRKLICSGTAVDYTPTSDLPGTAYQWEAINNSGGCITGVTQANGSGAINHVLINNCNTLQTISYFINPVGPGNCPGEPVELVVEVAPAFSVSVVAANPNPGYGTWTTIQANVTGGTGVFSYVWSGGQIASGQGSGEITTAPVFVNTQYRVDVTDQYNCSVNSSLVLMVSSNQPAVLVEVSPNPICPGESTTLTATATGGSNTFHYQWFDALNNPVSTNSENQIVVSPAQSTTYRVVASDGFNPDISGTVNVDVNITPVITSATTWEICSQQMVDYQPQSNVPGTTFEWYSTNNATDCIEEFGNSGQGKINAILVNNCLTPQNIIYTVVPTGPEPPVGGCPGTQQDILVRINPFAHIINTPTSQTLLSGTLPNPSMIPFSSNVTQNITYVWSTTGNPNIESNYPLTGTGNLVFMNPLNILNSGNETEVLEYSVFPVYNGILQDCPGQEFKYTLIVRQTPSQFQVQGGGVFCNDGVNCADVVLSGSQAGVNYQLTRNGAAMGPLVEGRQDGSAITWPCISDNGTYAVLAINSISGANTFMQGNVQVAGRELPSVFNTYAGQPNGNCSPVLPWLNGSQTGVVYQLDLERDGLLYNNLQQIEGTGSPLSFNEQPQSGIYRITAYRHYADITCSIVMSGSINALPLPQEFPITPQGILCEDAEELCITGSEMGIQYQLWLNNQPVAGTTREGTGGRVCFGIAEVAGTYRIYAKNLATGCETFFSQTIVINPQPVVYAINPQSDCAGAEILINGCQPNINYFLFFEPATGEKQFVQVAGPIVCNGSNTISFGQFTDAGQYRVKAVNPSTNCAVWMDNTTTIHPYPQVLELSPQGTGCTPVSFRLNGYEKGVAYFLYRDDILVSEIRAEGSDIQFGLQDVPGRYWVRARFDDPDDLVCWMEMSGEYVFNPQPLVYPITANGILPNESSYCPGITIGLSYSDPDIHYQLILPLGGIVELPGVGGPLSFGVFSQAGNYTARAVNPNTGCNIVMDGLVIIDHSPAVFELSSLKPPYFCPDDQNSVDILLNNSEVGVVYQLYKDSDLNPIEDPRAGTGGTLLWTALSQYGEGNYYVKARFANDPRCGVTMNGTISVQQIPSPQASIQGGFSICFGETAFIPLSLVGYGDLGIRVTYTANGVTEESLDLYPSDRPWFIPVAPVINTTYKLTDVSYIDFMNCSGSVGDLSVEVIVEQLPVVFAGGRGATCVNTPFVVEGSWAEHHTSVQWELVSGEGTLGLSSTINPVYIPSPNDAGKTVTIRLTATGKGPCEDSRVSDIFELSVENLPEILTQGSLATCVSQPLEIPQGHVTVNHSNLVEWKVKELTGAGTILNGSSLIPTYIPHPSDVGKTVLLEITARGNANCSQANTSKEIAIKVGARPVVWLSVIDDQSDSTRCQNQKVYFRDFVTYGTATAHPEQYISARRWEFTNPSGYYQVFETVNQSVIDNIFSEAGDFEVILTIETSIGNTVVCQSSERIFVSVHPTPIADFVTHSENNCTNRIQFEDQSSSRFTAIKSWHWDFGGGYFSIVPNPSYEYASPGMKRVTLSVSDQRGCHNSITKDFMVEDSFDFAIEYEPFCFGDMTRFQIAQGSIQPDGNSIKKYKWTFSHSFEAAFEPFADYLYETPGKYEVSLFATDITGCEKTKTIPVVVPGPLVPEFAVDDCNLNVSFYLMAGFNSNDIAEWVWDFGDGNSAIYLGEQPPVIYHNYLQDGNYTITLNVTDKLGCKGEFVSERIRTDCYEYLGYYVPTAFAPEHENPEIRLFTPKGMNIVNYHIRVMDLWGNVLWESTELDDGSPAQSWDGRYRGNIMPQGVYVWTAWVRFKDGTVWNGNGNDTPTGTVTLIR